MVWDMTTRVVVQAIDGLSRRVEVRADNIANMHTPGFRARHLDFESNLRAAVQRGEVPSGGARLTPTPSIIDDRDNSVELETELTGAMRDALHRDAMVQAFNFQLGQMRAATGGQR